MVMIVGVRAGFSRLLQTGGEDSVGIDPSRGTEATQPADYRRAQEGASPPKVQEGHV